LLLEEVNNSGAIRSSVALSQFTGRDIRVSFPESRVAPLPEVVSFLGGEETTVGGVYIGIQGDLQGAILQVFPGANLPLIDDILHHRPEGTTLAIADIDYSALSEVGNVLAASFIAAIADATGLAVTPEVPEIAVDMCLPVVDSVLARFALQGEQILLTEAVIYGEGIENVVCHFVLFLEPDSLRRLVEVLEDGARVEAG
jgi:chemotaxis protein CheC